MSKNKLIIEMTIFTAFLFVAFSLIIINEKKKDFLIPKVDKKLNQYIEENYSNIKNELKINKTVYNQKKSCFEMKVQNKENKYWYFYLRYKNKKIASTYKTDYNEGATILSHLEKNLAKAIISNQYPDINITFTKKLNQYNSSVRKKLIQNNNINTLNIYNISVTLTATQFTKNELISLLTKLNDYVNKENYNPKYYNITISNKNNITEELEIKKLQKKFITTNLEEIISGIINNDESIKSKFDFEFNYTN